MATKIWTGTTSGDYGVDSNWSPINIRSSDWTWTASGSGTAEYYLRTAASGDPGFLEPTNVQQGGAAMAAGTAGSLAAGEWDYADNDTLGYSTIYVRLTGGTDPDASASGHVTFTQPPVANDDVVIQGAVGITSGLDQSGVELDSFTVRSSYTGAIGSFLGFLQVDTADSAAVYFAGQGRAYIDLGSAAVSPLIEQTAAISSGLYGLNLTGSALVDLDLRKGAVELYNATLTGDIRQTYISSQTGDTTLSVPAGNTLTGVDLIKTGGTTYLSSALATITQDGGTLTTSGSGAITTVTINSGLAYLSSRGTITTLNVDGGTVDMTRSAQARTVTTLNRRGAAEVTLDPDAVTVTNAIASAGPMKVGAA